MLESITCDTEISELISEDDVSSYLSAIEEALSSYKQKIISGVANEQRNGGLSSDGFSIDDSLILGDIADGIVNSIANNNSFESYKADVLELVNNQRSLEISKLIEKLEEKIKELEGHAKVLADWIEANKSTDDVLKMTEFTNSLTVLNSAIEKYIKKLEAVGELS